MATTEKPVCSFVVEFTKDIEQGQLERWLMRALWSQARSTAQHKAMTELAKMFPAEFNDLMSRQLDKLNPGYVTIKPR